MNGGAKIVKQEKMKKKTALFTLKTKGLVVNPVSYVFWRIQGTDVSFFSNKLVYVCTTCKRHVIQETHLTVVCMFKLEVKKIVYIVRNEEQTVWTYTELKRWNS